MMRCLVAWLVLCGMALGQVQFDGVDDYVTCAYTNAVVPSTLSAWVTFDDLSSTAVLSWSLPLSGSKYFFLRTEAGGKIRTGNAPQSGTYSIWETVNSVVSTGEEFFIAAVWADAINATIYVDGESVDLTQTHFAGSPYAHSFDGMVLANDYLGTRRFAGVMDDYRQYSRALSAKEIKEIYHRPWGLADDPDLVLRTCVNGMYDDSRVVDLSGNGHTATNSGVTLGETSAGWMGEFHGAEYLTCGNVPGNGNDFTWCATIRVSNYKDYNPILVRDGNNSGNPVFRIDASGHLELRLYGLITLDSNHTIPENEMHHVSVVVSGTRIEFYDNGLLVSTNYLASVVNDTGRMTMGSYDNGGSPSYYDGDLFGVGIYDSALTSNDVYTLSQEGTITSTPIAHYTMQPAYLETGGTLAGIARNLGTGADGTYDNGPTVAPGRIQHVQPYATMFDAGNYVEGYRHYYNPGRFSDSDDHAGTNNGTLFVDASVTTNGWEISRDTHDYVLLDTPLTNGPDITVSMWVKPNQRPMDSNSYRGVVFSEWDTSSDASREYCVSYDRGNYRWKLMFRNGAENIELNNTNFTDGVWQHLAAVIDSGNNFATLYVNGVAGDVRSAEFTMGTSCAVRPAFGIGSWAVTGLGDSYDGYIDDVRFYYEPLTPWQVKDMYRAGRVQ